MPLRRRRNERPVGLTANNDNNQLNNKITFISECAQCNKATVIPVVLREGKAKSPSRVSRCRRESKG